MAETERFWDDCKKSRNDVRKTNKAPSSVVFKKGAIHEVWRKEKNVFYSPPRGALKYTPYVASFLWELSKREMQHMSSNNTPRLWTFSQLMSHHPFHVKICALHFTQRAHSMVRHFVQLLPERSDPQQTMLQKKAQLSKLYFSIGCSTVCSAYLPKQPICC